MFFTPIHRKALQMGPEMRASSLVSHESELCEALQGFASRDVFE